MTSVPGFTVPVDLLNLKEPAVKVPRVDTVTPEMEAMFKPWADAWIANAMSTKPMDDAEREIVRENVVRLYAAAGFPAPRVVFVASPFAARYVAGAAAWIWYCREHPELAGGAADTVSVTAPIPAALGAAATDPTADNTDPTADNRWYRDGNYAQAVLEIAGVGGLQCANKAWFDQGGNQWSGWVAYLSFFRYVCGLDLDYSKWDPYEKLAIHSGRRFVHEKFCVVSDRPTVLKVDDRNRPHCEDGPFCAWSDGTCLYSIHGVRVPGWVVEHPELITPALIDAEANAEVRRVMVDRYGMARYIKDGKSTLVHEDARGKLWRREQAGDEPICMVEVVNSTPEPDGTYKHYLLGVPPDIQTASEAVAWLNYETHDGYKPEAET